MATDTETTTSGTPAETSRLPEGRHDHAMRRASKRSGRERGCWVYVPAVQLLRAGFGAETPPPFYRVWGSARGRLVIQLYRTQ